MRNLIIIIIIVALGYFAYQAFEHSDVITSDTGYEQQLRDEGLEEFADGPVSSREAIRQLNDEGSTVFDKIGAQITLWRIDINTYINEKL